MVLDDPLALLLLALLPLAAVLARRRLRRLPGRRGALILALRCLLLALLVGALAQPALVQSYSKVSVVFLVDASASIAPTQQQYIRTWVGRALRALRPADEAVALTFAGVPLALTDLRAGGDLSPGACLFPNPPQCVLRGATPAITETTNIAAAVRAALGLLRDDGSGRIVLLSDGQESAADARAAAVLAAARRVGIVSVPLPPARRRDVLLAHVGTPTRARQGARLPVVVTVRSTYTTTAMLNVWSDGALAARQQVSLSPGATSYTLEALAGQQGLHTLTARISAPGDTVPQNDSLAAPVFVGPPARVLAVTSNVAAVSGLLALLRGQATHVDVVSPATMPASVAGLRPYDGLLLADVPTSALSSDQMVALHAAVKDLGKGLLVVGGRHSYSLGRYTRSPLEAMLPVWSIPPARLSAGRLALMLVVDKSGSMDETEHNVTKVAMVKEAATKTLSHLRPDDSLGVLAFDDQNHWIVPLHRISGERDKKAASAAIAKISADGNTMIYPALRAAFDALRASKAAARHIVLLTDGQGEDADFDGLVRTMRRAGVTLSTIAVGSDASVDLLRRMARLGGGRYYFTADPHAIPNIFILETRLSGGPPIVQGILGVHVSTDSPLLRSLVGANLPSLNGYGMTIAKDDAQVVLESSLHDPVLAAWQFGLGRVAAWTADWTPTWAGQWTSFAPAPRFWDDVLRWTLPAPASSPLAPLAIFQDGDLLLSASPHDATGAPLDLLGGDLRARVRGPGGLDTMVSLQQDAPGHYTGRLPTPRPGSYEVDLARYDGSVATQSATIGVAVPYPQEYAAIGDGSALLSDLSRITGSLVTTDPQAAVAPVGTGPKPPPQTHRTPFWETLLLLGLLLLPVDVGCRVLLNTPAAYRQQAHQDSRRDQTPRGHG